MFCAVFLRSFLSMLLFACSLFVFILLGLLFVNVYASVTHYVNKWNEMKFLHRYCTFFHLECHRMNNKNFTRWGDSKWTVCCFLWTMIKKSQLRLRMVNTSRRFWIQFGRRCGWSKKTEEKLGSGWVRIIFNNDLSKVSFKTSKFVGVAFRSAIQQGISTVKTSPNESHADRLNRDKMQGQNDAEKTKVQLVRFTDVWNMFTEDEIELPWENKRNNATWDWDTQDAEAEVEKSILCQIKMYSVSDHWEYNKALIRADKPARFQCRDETAGMKGRYILLMRRRLTTDV